MRSLVSSAALTALALMFMVFCGGCGGGSHGPSPSAPVFWGVDYGPFRANQSPNGGPQPTADQMRGDMPRLAALGSRIRTYTVAGAQAQIPTIANGYGIKTWAGAWIGPDLAQNDTEIQGLVAASSHPGLEAVIVGSEALLRGDVTSAQLTAYIQQVKSHVPVPVAYADTWSVLEQHPEVAAEADILMANVYPYWDSVAAEDGASYVLMRFNSLQAQYPDKQIVIGETGWPSAGSAQGAAIPGATQQRTFYNGLVNLLKQHPEVHVFVFEAFDEPYKQGADVEPHWGLYNEDGSTKSQLVPLIPLQPADPTR